MPLHTLSFTLGLAATAADLRDACHVRSSSYGHHMPSLSDPLSRPDDIDVAPETAILLCRDKPSGIALGTARIQTSGAGPLLIERCVDTPAHMRGQHRAEITRLSAVQGADPLVKLALWKASYLYCQAVQARWLVIGARSEALVRQYRRLGFDDVFADRRAVPLDYAGGVPHRVLAFDVVTAERTWRDAANPLYGFIFETTHPDIRLFGPASFARGRAGQVHDAIGTEVEKEMA